MKKLLICLTILFSFLFCDIVFADNVSAKTANLNSDNFKHYVQPLRDDMKTIRDNILNYYNYNSSTQDYSCLFNTSSGNPYGSCFIYNKTSNVYSSFNIVGFNYSPENIYYDFMINNDSSSTLFIGSYNTTVNTNFTNIYINENGINSSGYQYKTSNKKLGNKRILTSFGSSNQITVNNDTYNITGITPTFWSWVESSSDIKYSNYLFGDANNYFGFEPLNVYESNFNNLINSYSPNDNLIDNSFNFIIDAPPVLSFSTNNSYDSLNNLVSVDVRLNVSNYNSNYIYQFQENGTSGIWTTMLMEEDTSTNDYYFTWLFTENVNLYVRVIDRNNNFVTSSTLQIVDINTYENVSSVIDLGSNHYGYFSNYVLVQNVKSTTENNLVSILCERDRAFDNGFCSLFYSDLISNHSNIDYFNDTTFAFHTLFGDANNILVSNKYYVFNFRVLKPFVPDISNVVLSTNYGDIDLANNFDKVYYNDGGSYTDYAIVFNTNNITLDSSYNLNSISVYFSIPLSNYYYNNIPDSFTFSIYRAFKLSYYDSIPDSNEISNLFSINNLSSIDGVNSQNLFFTDTTFNTYGFGGIISAPFRLLYALEDYDTCSDITIPFPHSNQNLTLKCVRSSIPSSINPLISILQIVLSGLICYRIAVSTLALIKQVLNPNDTNIEVVDL